MKNLYRILGIVLLAGLCASWGWGDTVVINFDDVMHTVFTQSNVWNIVIGLGYLAPDFTIDPATCDINGGFVAPHDNLPITFIPNQILDADEFALMGAILANPNFDCTAHGGTNHTQILNAWNQNHALVWSALGGCVGCTSGCPGCPEVLIKQPGGMIPECDLLFTAMMTLGDIDSTSFPMFLFDLVVNNSTVYSFVGDPNVHMPDLSQFALLRQFLAWCGDADGDGYSNLEEYLYYYPRGGRAAYLAAALDPNVHPPSHTGAGSQICNGTGGLLGEYFNAQNMTNLTLTRTDQEVSFNWGGGSPSPGIIGADHFSACWTGWIRPDYSEPYTFSVRTDDGVRLWVNNQLVVDQYNDHSATTYSGTPMTLTANQLYPVRMDYYENGGDAVAWLGWESAHQTPQGDTKAIYEMNLVPGTGIGDRSQEWIYNPGNGHFYKITDPMTWSQGKALAQQWGGYLAMINDAAENQWITGMFGPLNEDFFCGGNDIATEGHWIWDHTGDNFFNGDYSNPQPVSPWYTHWNSGEPNNSSGNEDCLFFYHALGLWNDLNCDSVKPCLVESEVPRIDVSALVPDHLTVWSGSPFSLRASAQHTYGTVTYQWKQNGAPIPGATLATYARTATDASGGVYTCVISDDTSASAETTPAYVTVIPSSALPVSAFAGQGVLMAVCATIGACLLFRRRRNERHRADS